MAQWELLFFDNGSTDGSGEVARRRVPPRDEQGKWRIERSDRPVPLGEARNRCISQARARVVAFLDADDLWDAGKLEAQLDLLDRTGAGIVFSDATVVDSRGAPLGRFFQRWTPSRDRVHEALIQGNFIPLSSVIAQRDLFESLGGFDPELRVACDFDFWLRASRVTRVAFLDRPLASWRVHGTNLTGDFNLAYEENARILRRLLEGTRREDGEAYERRVRHALGVLFWKWGLRSIRSGGGLRAGLARVSEGLEWSGRGAAAVATAASFVRGQLRGLSLRIRMDRVADRTARTRGATGSP